MITLYEIFCFFEDQKSLVDRGEKAVNASDIQLYNYDPQYGQINAKVHASMKDKLYNVSISFDEHKIKECHCECAKGNDKCHHMAAVLIYTSKHVSRTDEPCYWNSMKVQEQPKSFEELFGSNKYSALTLQPTEDDKKFLFSSLKEHSSNTGLFWLMSPEPDSNLNHPLCNITHFEEIKRSAEFQSSIEKKEFLLQKMQLDIDQIQVIFEKTVGQRNNPLWGIYRRGRLTSSNFGLILKALGSNKIPPSLLTTLKGEYNLEKIKSVQWGICHEAEAIKLYEEITEIKVTPAGIFIHNSGLLGCSPDGLISSNAILEVKCPFSKCNDNILKDLNSGKWYLKTENVVNAIRYTSGDIEVYQFEAGDINLNMQHSQGQKYYHQIQGMLHLMNREICHLLVWTPKISILATIIRDNMWNDNVEKLIEFYKNIFVYNLL